MFHSLRLRLDLKAEQRKEIRLVLSQMRQLLTYRGEELNKRFWNMIGNAKEGWLVVNGKFDDRHLHYFYTTIYRFSAFFSTSYQIESRISYLDTKVALNEDIVLLKFLKLLQQCVCDAALYKSMGYDPSHENKHIFADNLRRNVVSLDKDGKILPLHEVEAEKKFLEKNLSSICYFFDGYVGDQNDLRRGRLLCLHLTLIAFLNKFGYDWQYTNKKKIEELLIKYNQNAFLKEYSGWVRNMKLEKDFDGILNRIEMIR